MKHPGKILSALILIIDFNILIPHILGVSMHNTLLPSRHMLSVIGACIISVIPFIYINIFPALKIRRTSTLRNKILEDGAAYNSFS